MKVMDIKPIPTSDLGKSNSYLTYAADNMRSMRGKKIEVKGAVNCTGHGNTKCESEGEHSWFNHAMDSHYTSHESNLPEGFEEPL